MLAFQIIIYRSLFWICSLFKIQFTAHCWICSLFSITIYDLLAFQVTIYRSVRFSNHNFPDLLAFQITIYRSLLDLRFSRLQFTICSLFNYNLPICLSRLQFTTHCWICSLFKITIYRSLLTCSLYKVTIYRICSLFQNQITGFSKLQINVKVESGFCDKCSPSEYFLVIKTKPKRKQKSPQNFPRFAREFWVAPLAFVSFNFPCPKCAFGATTVSSQLIRSNQFLTRWSWCNSLQNRVGVSKSRQACSWVEWCFLQNARFSHRIVTKFAVDEE